MADDRAAPTFEPSEHRNIRRPTNYWETFVHMVKASIGTGILAMPNAFAKAGYVVGICGTILVGTLCTYCMQILVRIQYELSRRNQKPSLSYTETADFSVKDGPECMKNYKYLGLSADMFVLGFQLGAACIYLIFVSKNVKQVLENYVNITLDIRIYCLLILIPVLLAALIDNLKFLSILSFTANVTLVLGFLIIFYYIFKDIGQFGELLKNRTTIGNVSNYPLFTGTVVFSMEAIGVVMPLENEMEYPLQFTSTCGVLNCAMIPTVILYITIGLLGYIKYGNEVSGSVTLDLPQKEYLSQSCKLLLSYEIYVTYVLALFVAHDIIWKSYIQTKLQIDQNSWRTWSMQYGLRVLLIIFTCCLAILIPNLELFISLVGSLCLATAGIAYPALFNMLTYWKDNKGAKFYLWNSWYSFIIIIGVVICIMGVTLSLKDIYEAIYA